MDYDEDSFLAGFAVGRILWKPHRDYVDLPIGAYPCFPSNSPVPLDFSYTDGRGITHQYVLFNVIRGTNAPDPLYWMLWENTESVSEITKYRFVYFSPSLGDYSIYAGVDCYGIDENGNEQSVKSQSFRFLDVTQGEVIKSFVTTSIDPNNPPRELNPAPFVEKWPYLTATYNELVQFLRTGQFINTPNQLYIVGDVP